MNRKQLAARLGLPATLILAIAAFVVGYFTLSERIDLVHRGERTEGVVIGIHVGVKGLKSAEVAFETRNGREVIGRDIHKTHWYPPNDMGDRVTLYYDPGEPAHVLIERGLWKWSNPFLLFAGGLFMLGLGIAIARHDARKSSKT